MTFVVPMPGTSQATADFASADVQFHGSNQTSYTFTGAACGNAAPDRRLLIFAAALSGSAMGGMNVDGVAATQVAAQDNSTHRAKVFIIDKPTGTTCDIEIETAGGSARHAYACYALYGAGSATAFDTASDTSVPLQGAVDSPAGGVVMAACVDVVSATASWSNVSEDADFVENQSGVNFEHVTCAHAEFEPAQTALSAEVTKTANSAAVLIAVSYGP